jgi:hypothetical protein
MVLATPSPVGEAPDGASLIAADLRPEAMDEEE